MNDLSYLAGICHIVPMYVGEHKHAASVLCPCEPTMVYENPYTGSELWQHIGEC